jgi:hypothetical protein
LMMEKEYLVQFDYLQIQLVDHVDTLHSSFGSAHQEPVSS